MSAKKAAAKKKKKGKRKPQEEDDFFDGGDLVDLLDKLDTAIAVVRTAVGALNEPSEQHVATVLLEHGFYPLLKIKEALGSGK